MRSPESLPAGGGGAAAGCSRGAGASWREGSSKVTTRDALATSAATPAAAGHLPPARKAGGGRVLSGIVGQLVATGLQQQPAPFLCLEPPLRPQLLVLQQQILPMLLHTCSNGPPRSLLFA